MKDECSNGGVEMDAFNRYLGPSDCVDKVIMKVMTLATGWMRMSYGEIRNIV